ncbi:MAG: N-acetylmuramoyl-L-alanine amidase [Defluviitaleaceae bacterium]|nr:N-acetylmuramoyl-L-alanine amidase [Defluviitaleaceae bacterium]
MNLKKQICAVLISIMCIAIIIINPLSTTAAAPIGLVINGQTITGMPMPPVIQQNRTLVPARAVFQDGLGAEVEWQGETRTVSISYGETHILLVIGSRVIIVNGHPSDMPIPAQIINGNTMIPLRAVAENLGFEVDFKNRTVFIDSVSVEPIDPEPTPPPVIDSTPTPPPRGSDSRVVIVDPGHGGRPGAVYDDVRAADLNLAIAEKLIQLIEECGYMTVYTTRTGDYIVELNDRVQFANERGDIMVTIHHNAWHTPYINGVETFYRTNEFDTSRSLTSQNLARIIQRQILDHTGRNDRGSRTADFVILRYSEIPTVLIEVGFMSNPEEFATLISAEYQWWVAQAIFEGLLEAFLLYSQ